MAGNFRIVKRKDGYFQVMQGENVLFVGSYLDCLQEEYIAEQEQKT